MSDSTLDTTTTTSSALENAPESLAASVPGTSPASVALAPRPRLSWVRIVAFSVAGLMAIDAATRLMLRSMESPLHWAPKDWGVYGLGVLWSLLSWFLMPMVVLPLMKRWPRRVIAGALAAWLGIVLLATVGFRFITEQSPSWQALRFFVDKPGYAFELGKQFLGILPVLVALLTMAGLYLMGRVVLGQAPAVIEKKRYRIGAVVLYTGLTVMLCVTPGMQSPLPIDALGMTSFGSFGVASISGERHLVTPVRAPLPPPKETNPPSVLLLLHESLSADLAFAGLDYKGRFDVTQTGPFVHTLPSREAEGFFVLPQARSNATATESSVPSVLSGVDLGGATDAYGTAQSIWSLGKATQAETFLFSSCSYNWSHFDEFFVDKNIDYVKTGLDLGPKIVNDSGVDDRLMVDPAIAHVKELAASKKRFVGIIHFDATHLPGYWGPGTENIKAEPDVRYPKAARYVDEMNRDIVNAVISSEARDSTIIIATSDHGEQIPPKREPNRLGNYYERTVRIPVWIYIPPKVLAKHPEYGDMLRAWKTQNAQNMDVLPTIRDFLTLPKTAELTFPGRSWLEKPPALNQVAGQSTTSFRQWNNEGFYVVRDRIKIIVSSEQRKPEIYDLSSDFDEQHDLWDKPEMRKMVEPWLRELVKNGEERRTLCERLGETRCPYL